MSRHSHDRDKRSGPPQPTVIPGAVPDAVENTPAVSTSTSSTNQITGSSSLNQSDPFFLRRPSAGTSEGRVQAAEVSESGPGQGDGGGLSLNTGVTATSEVVSFHASGDREGLSLVHDEPIKDKITQGIRESVIGSGSDVGMEYVESDGRSSSHRVGGEKGKRGPGDGVVSSGTFMFQSQLPKLQVPPLEDTLSRYLLAVQPLLSPEAFLRTKAVVEEVSDG